MKLRGSDIVLLAGTLAAGFVAGVLFAPASGKKTRGQIGDQARRQLSHAEKKLEDVERQLTALNERVGETTSEWSDKLKDAARETVDQHLPDLSMPGEKWDIDDKEMKQELRKMAR